MGLMQRAVETYDNNRQLIGVYSEGSEPLAPVGHILTRADIEVTLNSSCEFLSARRLDKSEPKILIPVTEESGGRSGTKAYQRPHPLCDAFKYYAAKENYYLPQLERWMSSEYSHPFLNVVYGYLTRNTLESDITASIGKISGDDFICWRITGIDGEEPACWKNQNLFSAFINYYLDSISSRKAAVCMIYGEPMPPAVQHPKGIVAINGNAKLISANDSLGFTYRGRFADADEACTVSYAASQKAHNALRWLASEQGVREVSGNRIFICWNPRGVKIPKPMRPMRGANAEPVYVPSDYKAELRNILYSFGHGDTIKDADKVITAAFDAATTGRLALAYYNENSMGVFLERLYEWDENCCWYNGKNGIQAPNLIRLIDCAYGTQRGNFLETDDRIQKQHLQRLLDCKINGGVFPTDIVQGLVNRASNPNAYDESIWRQIVYSACAAMQKYFHDTKRGGNEMAWELSKNDRSFQYGRLLAVMERAEADYYRKTQESRQTNAIKFMSEYRQRPFYVFERINRALHQAYLNRIDEWQANRYERLVSEIFQILGNFDESELDKPLDNIYLMGYELQRNSFFDKTKTENSKTEE